MATTDAQLLSLRPPYVALEWYRGRTTAFTVTVKDENGTPVNLTGSTVTMAIKNAAGATLLTYSTATGQGITLTNPALGQLTVSPEARWRRRYSMNSPSRVARMPMETMTRGSRLIWGCGMRTIMKLDCCSCC